MSNNEDFWLAEVARLHQRSVEAIETNRTVAAGELRENFNELLPELQTQFPTDPIIRSTETIPVRKGGWGEYYENYLSEVRNRTQRIAQKLEIELDDVSDNDNQPQVSIENVQSATQSMTTEVHVQTQIDVGPWDGNTKEELREAVREYQEELESEEPDESRLRQLLKKVEDRSPEVAANMGIMALEKAMTGILNL